MAKIYPRTSVWSKVEGQRQKQGQGQGIICSVVPSPSSWCTCITQAWTAGTGLVRWECNSAFFSQAKEDKCISVFGSDILYHKLSVHFCQVLFQYQRALINNPLMLHFYHKVTRLIPCGQRQMASCVWLNHFSGTLSLYAFGIKLLYALLSNLYKACCLLGRVWGKTEQFRLFINTTQFLTRLNFHSKDNNFHTKTQISAIIIVFQYP